MMALRIRNLSVLLVLFLICSQGLSSSPPPRRQKRGIMKMMMHIMWDPVRLIRYWYAYDVTKEIAKSWRKILPTMLLLPFNPTDTPGVAKYVHPTHGLGATKYHKNIKQLTYPAVSSGESYSASQGYLISDPSFKNIFSHLPSSLEGGHKHSDSSNLDSVPLVFQQHFNSRQVGGEDSQLPVRQKEVDESSDQQQQHIILQPVPERFFQKHLPASLHTSNNQHIILSGEGAGMKQVPYPYKIDLSDDSREHIILKPVEEFHGFSREKIEGDIVPSSTNSDSKRTKMKYSKNHSHYAETQPSYASFQIDPNSQVKYEDDDKDGHVQPTQHVIHTGHQELHIVLHPIPLGSVGPSNSGQALHFIPVNINNSESANGFFPKAFPGRPETSNPDDSLLRTNASPTGYDEDFYPSNNSSSKSEETASSERSDDKSSGVTWVLKQDSKTDRRTDNDSEGSAPRLSSVDFEEDGKQVLRLNGQSIDLVQLKEDLRHGTPVLIPFAKKSPFSYLQTDLNQQVTTTSDKSEDVMDTTKQVSIQSNSAEQFDDRNSTQRLLFFYKRQS